MKKYIVTETREAVNLGRDLVIETNTITEYGKSYSKEEIPVTEKSIPYLIKRGIIEEVEEPSKEKLSVKMINKIAEFFKWDSEDAFEFLAAIYRINETAFRNIIYKKVAVELDKKYKDHIKDCEHLWIINSVNKNILYIYNFTRENKEYKNIALFRSKDDAQMAKDVADNIILSFEKSDE